MRDLIFCQDAVFVFVIDFKAAYNLFVRHIILWIGLHQKVKMVAHDAEAKDINEIDRGQEFEDFEEDFFVSVSNGQSLQGGSGDDVIDSGLVSDQHAWDTWHDGYLL
jgi:hypothetical protein